MLKAIVGGGAAVLGFAALLIGPTTFAVVVIVLGVVMLLDLAVLLAGAGAKPVLPVALIPGLALPVLVAAGNAGDPGAGWDRIPDAFAVAFLLGFALILAFGRRRGVVMGLSATAMASLVVGLGVTSAILLRALPDGFAWVAALLLLVLAADLAAPLIRAVQRRRRDAEDDYLRSAAPPSDPLQGVVPALVAVALVSVGLGLFFGPPLQPLVLALLGLIAVVAALGGAYLQRALSTEAGVHPDAPAPRLGEGLVVGALDAVVIAAPAAYVLARSVSL